MKYTRGILRELEEQDNRQAGGVHLLQALEGIPYCAQANRPVSIVPVDSIVNRAQRLELLPDLPQ